MSFVTVVGRLGRDAELRQGDDPAKSVLNFSVAEDIGFGDKRRTQWWGAALWGKRAESLAPYLTKGTPVTVVGNPELRTFEKKDKTQGSELTVRVVDVFLQGRGGEKETPAGTPAPTPAAAPASKPAVDEFGDETIPFAHAWLAPLAGLVLAAHGVAGWLA